MVNFIWKSLHGCLGKTPLSGNKTNHCYSKGYFDRNKADLVGFASAQLTADALELSRVTVDRVMRDYRKDPSSIDNPQKMRGKPSYAVDASNQEVVRAYVRKANLEGSYITLETIRD